MSDAELFKNLYYSMIMYQLFPTNLNVGKKVNVSDVKNLVVLHDQSDLPEVDDVEIVNYAIFRDDDLKRYYLAFRGSSTQNDWFINANTAPVDALYGSNDGPCYVFCGYHSIIQNTYFKIFNDLQSDLGDKIGYSLSVTGHSLGGGMTNIFVLKYNYESVVNLPLYDVQYAFAAPIVLWHNSKTPDVLDKIVNVAAQNDIVPRLGGARTLDITQAQLENILKSNPLFGFSLGSTLNEALSPLTISANYVPAQSTTLILSPDGSTTYSMSRQEVIDEAVTESKKKPVKDRKCLQTPISKLTIVDHLQPSYYNVLLKNNVFKLQDVKGGFYIMFGGNKLTQVKVNSNDTSTQGIYEGLLPEQIFLNASLVLENVQGTLKLKWQSVGKSSQIWTITSDGYLANLDSPTSFVQATRGFLDNYYTLSIPSGKNYSDNYKVKFDFESLNNGFISASNIHDKNFVLTPLDGFVGPDVEVVLFVRSELLPGFIGDILDTFLYYLLIFLPTFSVFGLLEKYLRFVSNVLKQLTVVLSNWLAKKGDSKTFNAFPPLFSNKGKNQKWMVDLAFEKNLKKST